MTSSSKFIFWVKFVIILFCLILILIGFGFGYIYNNYVSGECIDKPLFYGIQKLNDASGVNFTCSCSSLSNNMQPFSFDENGIIQDIFITHP